jgi:hypothetical protein
MKIRAETLKTYAANFLNGRFMHQTETTEQDDTSITVAPTTLHANALSTVFDTLWWSIHCYNSTMATFQYYKTQHFVRYYNSKYD